jgi:hypothetical protein
MNCPQGGCRELTVNPVSFKEQIEGWLEDNRRDSDFLDASDEQRIRSSLDRVGYDLHQYMMSHAYDEIANNRLKEYFLVYNCLAYSPAIKLIKINSEEYKETYDVDMRYIANDMRWGKFGNKSTVSYSTVYCRLYFCETEQDIWDIFADGVGDIDSLYDYYAYDKDDEEKALDVLLYIYNVKNKKGSKPKSVKNSIAGILEREFLEDRHIVYFSKNEHDIWDIFADGAEDLDSLYDYYAYEKKDKNKAFEAIWYIYNKKVGVRGCIAKILKNKFFEGMDDDFFNRNNFLNAKFAWDLNIPEIRQEYIRDDHALAMLKKIL